MEWGRECLPKEGTMASLPLAVTAHVPDYYWIRGDLNTLYCLPLPLTEE